jgi:peptide-methionine (S)-S-oxide reductase
VWRILFGRCREFETWLWATQAEGSKIPATTKSAVAGPASYEDLLKVFFENHDPTTLNRQGPDVGEQYRSAIFFHSPEQEASATAVKGRLEEDGGFRRPIVTEISPASRFWRAEEYHQRYFEKHGISHCRI